MSETGNRKQKTEEGKKKTEKKEKKKEKAKQKIYKTKEKQKILAGWPKSIDHRVIFHQFQSAKKNILPHLLGGGEIKRKGYSMPISM